MTKQEEYTLMLNSKLKDLITPIKNRKDIKWLKVWDHQANTSNIIFKTLNYPPYINNNIVVEEIDLMPIANKKIYKIIIKKN